MRRVLIGIFVLVIVTAGSAIAVKVYRQNASPQPQGAAAYGYGYGTCQRGGVGGCCPAPGQDQGQAVDLEAVKKIAMDYYITTYSDKDVTVQVKDFGCHQEAYVIKDGKQLKRLSISGNRVYEIG